MGEHTIPIIVGIISIALIVIAIKLDGPRPYCNCHRCTACRERNDS
jgi:hypothetical protein